MNFFDLHCDTPYECFVKNQGFNKNNLSVSGDKGKCFGKWYLPLPGLGTETLADSTTHLTLLSTLIMGIFRANALE